MFKGEFKFFPAIAGITLTKHLWRHSEYDYVWWTKRALYYHPFSLLSYGTVIENKENINETKNIRWFLEVCEDQIVIFDSGGFEILTRNLPISPKQVLEWQIQNSTVKDIIVILDVPPRALTQKEIEWNHFERCMLKTQRNIDCVKDKLQSVDCEVFLVLHGINLEEYEKWYKNAIKPFINFSDGVAYAVHPAGDPIITILALLYLYEKDVSKVHLFSGTDWKVMVACTLVSHLFEWVSGDSSTITKWLVYAQIVLPWTMRATINIFNKGVKNYSREVIRLLFNICDCPACQYARKNHPSIYEEGRTDNRLLLGLHNLYWIEKFNQFLIFMKKAGKLEEYIYQINNESLNKALEIYHMWEDVGDIRKVASKFGLYSSRSSLARWLA